VCVEGPAAPRVGAVLGEALDRAEVARSRYATGQGLLTFGDLAWRQRDIDAPMSRWERALVALELVDRRGIASCLERLAWGLAAQERYTFAACAFGAADAQHRLLAIDLRADEWRDHDRGLGTVRRRLSDEAFAAGWSAGQTCNLADITQRVLDWTR
jgi:hypothetical protein